MACAPLIAAILLRESFRYAQQNETELENNGVTITAAPITQNQWALPIDTERGQGSNDYPKAVHA